MAFEGLVEQALYAFEKKFIDAQKLSYLLGEMGFTRNHNRQAASRVSKAGLEGAFYIGHKHNGKMKMFSDTVGTSANYGMVNVSGNDNEAYYPYRAMIAALSELTGKQAYQYRAFELLVTLDLTIYKAVRRIIVPANLEFARLHNILQSVFDWKNYHLYDFTILGDKMSKPVARLVPFEEDLEYDIDALLMRGRILSEFLPEHKHIRYTYDMGDNWEHEIELVRVIEAHDEESPYLLEASGQTPPEDVGGVGGFVNFHGSMQNTSHPEYPEMKRWSAYWTTELREWSQHPRVIRS